MITMLRRSLATLGARRNRSLGEVTSTPSTAG